VGPFDEAQALTLEELAERPDPVTLSLADAIERAMPVRRVTADEARELGFGRAVPAAGLEGTYGAVGPDGSAVALLAESVGSARPVVVFRPADLTAPFR
jgi:tRNA pseudouridine55 synthase